jgi:DNA repair exonuclease SbcCD ATPase subunit
MPEVQDQPIDKAALKETYRASMDAAFKGTAPQPVIQRDPEAKVVPQPGAPPAQAKPEVVPQQDKTPKGLREELEKRATRVKELESKLAEYEPRIKEADTFKTELQKRQEELEAIAKERDGLKKLESVAALEQSPEFQKKYVQGREALATRLQQLAEMAKISPAELLSAAQKPEAERYTALEDLISSAPRLLQDKLVRTVEELDALDIARRDELSQAHERMQERLREKETGDRRTREERLKTRTEAFDTVAARLKGEGLDDATIAAHRDSFISNKITPAAAAEAYLKGQRYNTMAAKVKELEAEVLAYQSGTPGVRAGKTHSGGNNSDLDNMPLQQRMNELAKRRGIGS